MKTNTVKKMQITWQEIENLAKRVAKQIKTEKFDAIICIGRGSMVPSRLISEYADIKQIYFADVKAYTEDNKLGKVSCKMHVPKFKQHQNILIVDDCFTTGTTMNAVWKALFENKHFFGSATKAVLFKNKHSLEDVIYGKLYDAKKTWLVFPWEADDSKQPKQETETRTYKTNNTIKYMY